jgi:hypothetical protein
MNMLKSLEEYGKGTHFYLVMRGLVSAVSEIYQCQQDYLVYKTAGPQELSRDRELEMRTLELLEELGYDFNDLGTCLYTKIVVKTAMYLENENDRNNLDVCRNLILVLQDAYSQFYFDLARNELDMGTKTFHAYIAEAHRKRDINKPSPELLKKIYGQTDDISLPEQTFLLGNFVAGNLMPTDKETEKLKQYI